MRAQVEQAGSQGSSRRLRRKGAHRRGDILSPAEGQGLSLVSGSESLLSLSPSLPPTYNCSCFQTYNPVPNHRLVMAGEGWGGETKENAVAFGLYNVPSQE